MPDRRARPIPACLARGTIPADRPGEESADPADRPSPAVQDYLKAIYLLDESAERRAR